MCRAEPKQGPSHHGAGRAFPGHRSQRQRRLGETGGSLGRGVAARRAEQGKSDSAWGVGMLCQQALDLVGLSGPGVQGLDFLVWLNSWELAEISLPAPRKREFRLCSPNVLYSLAIPLPQRGTECPGPLQGGAWQGVSLKWCGSGQISRTVC